MNRLRAILLVLGLAGLAAACGLLAPPILWQVPVNGAVNVPPIWSGPHVYLATSQKVYALDVGNGKVLWQRAIPGGVRYSPALDPYLLYTHSTFGTLHALDRSSGKELWQFRGQTESMAPPGLLGDRVLGLSRSHLFAVDRASGRVKWRRAIAVPVPDSLAVVGDRACLVTASGNCRIYHAPTGVLQHTFQARGPVAAPPVVTPGAILVATTHGWIHVVSVLTGKALWSYNLFKPVLLQPIFHGGQIYVAAGTRIYAIPVGGRVRWSYGCEGEVIPPMLVQGQIFYAYTDRGTLHALDAESGHLYWSAQGLGPPQGKIQGLSPFLLLSSQEPATPNLRAVDPISGGTLWNFTPPGTVPASPVQAADLTILGTRNGWVVALRS